jgi:8-oxo-dGTP pyrophosphatase MutT (NUDIX family)
MDYAEAVDRLSRPFPERWPQPPPALTPVLTSNGGRRPEEPEAPAVPRAAAVLVLVVPGPHGEARVILTERANLGGHHSGEVSLPGGAIEPDDVDDVAAAFREASEEIGLDARAAGVRFVGRLESFVIPVSGFTVTPVVAVARHRWHWHARPEEVRRVVEAPLAAFLPDAPIVLVHDEIRGMPLRYGAYPVEDLVVWGATARILSQLGAILAGQAGPGAQVQRGSPSAGS